MNLITEVGIWEGLIYVEVINPETNMANTEALEVPAELKDILEIEARLIKRHKKETV